MTAPNFYKTGGVNRFRIGLWSALGKGIEVNDEGEVQHDYLEILGHRLGTTPYRLDWTAYGSTDVQSLEEKRFEEVSDYWDIDGNPDIGERFRPVDSLLNGGEVTRSVLCHMDLRLVLPVHRRAKQHK